MSVLDNAVLTELEQQLLGPGMVDDVLDVVMAQLQPAKVTLQTDRAAIEQAVTRVEAEIANLTGAIASGADLRSLVSALKAREQERDRLAKQLAHAEVTERRAEVTPSHLREQLALRFKEWRAVLRKQPQVARQIVKKLVVGPVRFTPQRDEQGRGYYTFEAEGSLAKLLGNVVPIMVTSPTGFV